MSFMPVTILGKEKKRRHILPGKAPHYPMPNVTSFHSFSPRNYIILMLSHNPNAL